MGFDGKEDEGAIMGGARSPRPGCEVSRTARNFSTADEWARGWWFDENKRRLCPGLLDGRAEPAPPRGGEAAGRWLRGEGPEVMREAIFSEGRGLRARVVRPYVSRGTSLSRVGRREASAQRRGHLVRCDAVITGVQSPALRGVDHPDEDGLAGKMRR